MNSTSRPIVSGDIKLAQVLGIATDGDSKELYERLGRVTDTATLLFHGATHVFEDGMLLSDEIKKLNGHASVQDLLTEDQKAWREHHHRESNGRSGFVNRSETHFLGREVKDALEDEPVSSKLAKLVEEALAMLASEFGIDSPKKDFVIASSRQMGKVHGIGDFN